MKKTIIIYDYDWTLVNENSDTFIFDQLCPSLKAYLNDLYRNQKIPWTKAINLTLNKMYSLCDQSIVSPDLICKTLSNIPILDYILDGLDYLYNKGHLIYIVSDSNTIYIESMIEKYNLKNKIHHIFTNPSYFNDLGQLIVTPYHLENDIPHGCIHCPINMCKGMILDTVLIKYKENQNKNQVQIQKEIESLNENENQNEIPCIIYIGDGEGDYCPTTRMKENDVILARKHTEPGKEFGLLRKLALSEQKDSIRIKAKLFTWTNGLELFEVIQNIK